MLADNQFADRSTWDDASLALHLKELSELATAGKRTSTMFSLAGSAETEPTYGTTPAPIASNEMGARATSTSIQPSNRSRWSPTPFWINESDDIVLDPFLGSGTTLLAAERAQAMLQRRTRPALRRHGHHALGAPDPATSVPDLRPILRRRQGREEPGKLNAPEEDVYEVGYGRPPRRHVGKRDNREMRGPKNGNRRLWPRWKS